MGHVPRWASSPPATGTSSVERHMRPGRALYGTPPGQGRSSAGPPGVSPRPVSASASQKSRAFVHISNFFLSGLAKAASKSIWMDPAFLLGEWFDSHFFFRWSDIVGVEVIFRPARVPRVCTHGGTRCQSSLSVSLVLTEYSWLGYCILLCICIRRSARHKAWSVCCCHLFILQNLADFSKLVSYDQVRKYHRSIRVSITSNCCGKCYVVSLECADVPW